eukprot:8254195-Pyramimonas_sp.AAC.2
MVRWVILIGSWNPWDGVVPLRGGGAWAGARWEVAHSLRSAGTAAAAATCTSTQWCDTCITHPHMHWCDTSVTHPHLTIVTLSVARAEARQYHYCIVRSPSHRARHTNGINSHTTTIAPSMV